MRALCPGHEHRQNPWRELNHGEVVRIEADWLRAMGKETSLLRRSVPLFGVATGLTYFGLCAALFAQQRSLLYFPQPMAPGGEGATAALRQSGPKVLMSVREHDGDKALIYFGGNKEDVSQNLPPFSGAFPKHAIYLLHYRSYGGSAGQPSEQALFEDALALFDFAHARHQRVVVIGRSLGSGLAVRVASVRPATRLVLVTPYDSIAGIASQHYPWFPVRWLLRDKYESWRYAPAVTAPTLVIAAGNDQTIPRASTDPLLTRFREGVASMQVIADVDHGSLPRSPQYLPLLAGTAGATSRRER